MTLESVLRNAKLADSPSLTTITGSQISSDAITLGQGVDIVGVSNIKSDCSVDPS